MPDSPSFQVNDGAVMTSGATSQTMFAPTAALLIALFAAQSVATAVAVEAQHDPTSALTSVILRNDLADELLAFHRRLAESQTDLPEDAARILRENLWALYDEK